MTPLIEKKGIVFSTALWKIPCQPQVHSLQCSKPYLRSNSSCEKKTCQPFVRMLAVFNAEWTNACRLWVLSEQIVTSKCLNGAKLKLISDTVLCCTCFSIWTVLWVCVDSHRASRCLVGLTRFITIYSVCLPYQDSLVLIWWWTLLIFQNLHTSHVNDLRGWVQHGLLMSHLCPTRQFSLPRCLRLPRCD